VLFLAGKASNSKYSLGNLDDLTKRRHLSANLGLKYLDNDGINQDRFHCKIFPKIHTLGRLNNLGLILSGVSL